MPSTHKSGFVNIIGRPNVGKSTLINALMGDKLSIITKKPQTTRHRILGIANDEDYQIVFSDTPGFIENPAYEMQQSMNVFVNMSFEDADLVLFITDVAETYEADHPLMLNLKKLKVPVFLVLNKTDLVSPEAVVLKLDEWRKRLDFKELIPVSALHNSNVEKLYQLILKYLPEGPAYYPKDQWTDRSERFFVSEIIREKILLHYHQEIPYSVEVAVNSFKEDTTKRGDKLMRIEATIFVNRKTQKSILIGKGGAAIKNLGTEARRDIEEFLDSKVFLELHVKVKAGWRDDDRTLKYFGYKE